MIKPFTPVIESDAETVLTCYQCSRPLTSDEIALHKRIINRGAASHLCLSCLAAYFECNEDLLRSKIEHFRNIGCTLFESNNKH